MPELYIYYEPCRYRIVKYDVDPNEYPPVVWTVYEIRRKCIKMRRDFYKKYRGDSRLREKYSDRIVCSDCMGEMPFRKMPRYVTSSDEVRRRQLETWLEKDAEQFIQWEISVR